MKKALLVIFVLVFIGLNGQAQNTDIRSTKVTFKRLPLTPLPEDVTKYWVNIDLGYLYSGDSKTETTNKIKNAARIPHLEKTIEEGLELLVRTESYYKSEVRYESEVVKEKRGDKQVEVTHYYLTFDYKYPLYFEAKLPGAVDPLVSEFSNKSNEMITYSSKRFPSSSELNKWWNSNYRTIQGDLRMKLLEANVSSLGNRLEQLYSYPTFTFNAQFGTVKKFKDFDYTDIDNAYDIAKEALTNIAPNHIVFNDAFEAKMEEAIVIWKKALEESDLESRKTRINKKVTGVLYENIYLAYTMMSEFDKADEIRSLAEGKLGKYAVDSDLTRFFDERKIRFIANEGRIPNSI